MKVGVFPNLDKPEARALARRLAGWLRQRRVTPVCSPGVARQLFGGGEPLGEVTPVGEWPGQVAFAVVLGGDGTLLKAARLLSPGGVPLLGVNLGRLGFLTEVEAGHLESALPAFLEGECVMDERATLAVEVRAGNGFRSYVALNDAVVSVAPFARLGTLSVFVSGSLLGSYPADGIIVATPTGSTAYSLAAGGPIVTPDLDALLVTPVCPHTFYARPTVISKHNQVLVRVDRSLEGAVVTVDGQERCPLGPGEEVEVRVGEAVAKLMRRPGWDFYSVLRRKLTERASWEKVGGEAP